MVMASPFPEQPGGVPGNSRGAAIKRSVGRGAARKKPGAPVNSGPCRHRTIRITPMAAFPPRKERP